MNFEEMNIEDNVLGSLNKMGFEKPTEIQSETIPIIKNGFDVIGQSETGSGKTAAFGIPLVEKVVKGEGIQALVLEPTRELSIQTAKELKKFSRLKDLYVQTIYGGVGFEPQVAGIRKAEIIVGTPGRILDHMRRGNLDFRKIKIFVLDEADKMIDMGFVDDIDDIERSIPKERQSLLFSATMPERLEPIKKRFTKNAKSIKTKIKVSEDFLKQFYCDVNRKTKFSLLVHLIKKENSKLAMIFCNSRRDVELISRNLQKNRINAASLHGGLTQARREKTIDDFHKGKVRLLIATDVASRGLDIKNVTHVFNYSIPKDSESFTNRIGRTARAGEDGKAISLLSREDHEAFRRIVNRFSYDIKNLEIQGFKILPFDTGRRGSRRPRRSSSSNRRRTGSAVPRNSKLFKPKW